MRSEPGDFHIDFIGAEQRRSTAAAKADQHARLGQFPHGRLRDGGAGAQQDAFRIRECGPVIETQIDGATLPDPKGILLGSGNRIRHITIKTPADIKRPEIRAYIRRARKKALSDARKLGEPAPPKPAGVISTVKAIYPKKRRPK